MKKDLIIPSLKTSETIRFIKELHETKLSNDDELYLHMNSTWVEPLGMLLCSSAIRHYAINNIDKKMFFSHIDSDAINYATYMGFFKAISKSISRVGKTPGAYGTDINYVPITAIDFDALHSFEIENGNYIEMGDIVEKKSQELAKVICRSDKNLQHLFSYIIREVLRNTPEHAETNEATICGQYWSNGRASIAIVDDGIGIKKSLEKNSVHKEYVQTDEDALQVCVRPGISQSFTPEKKNKDQDPWANSGFGLYMSSEICKKLNGDFWIISGNKALKITRSGSILYDTFFSGTAIGISFNVKNVEDSKKMIIDISKRGEFEAQGIRNAFQKASTPSKSLLMNNRS